MQIFVQPRNGDSFDEAIRRAPEILQNAMTLSARAGRSIMSPTFSPWTA
jgi:hypothetical protein